MMFVHRGAVALGCLSLILLLSCGGGEVSDSASASESIDPAASDALLAEGLESLKTGDVSAAQTKFDEAATKNPGNSQAQFGAALMRIILLPETTPGTALQDGLNFQNQQGSARWTTSLVAGSSGFLAELAAFNRGTGPEPDKLRFPLYGLTPQIHGTKGNLYAPMVLVGTPNGFMTSEAQRLLQDFESLYEEIIDILVVAAEDENFEFTVPKEAFSGDFDIAVNRSDLLFLLAAMQFNRMGLSFFNSWDFEIDLGSIYDDDGSWGKKASEQIATLNAFFTLKNTNELSDAKRYMADGLITLLDAIDSLPTTDTTGIAERLTSTDAEFTALREVVVAIQDSLGGVTALPTAVPATQLDLDRLFADPPDASTIDIDPFVVENGKVRWVEAFFDQFINRFLPGVSVDQASFSMLKDVFRTGFAETLFDELLPFTIGGKPL